MQAREMSTMARTDIRTAVRNLFPYGKLLDEFHFTLEQKYFNHKRWLLNRLVTGYGVVCGLNVKRDDEGEGIVVERGVAIDKCGREIILPKPHYIPAEELHKTVGKTTKKQQAQEKAEDKTTKNSEMSEEEAFVHLLICYHECESDPTPILAGDCPTSEACAPGSVREKYELKLKPGCAPPIETNFSKLNLPDFICGGQLSYEKLVEYVSCSCPDPPTDCCIPLANIRIAEDEEAYKCVPKDIDITVRPIVFTNDLLFELLLSLLHEAPARGVK